jgi:hypothetical protein
MVRSQEHAFTKYATRIFAVDELARGWHQVRRDQNIESFKFPPPTVLRRLPNAAHRNLDRTDPWTVHYWKLAEHKPAPDGGQPSVKADTA